MLKNKSYYMICICVFVIILFSCMYIFLKNQYMDMQERKQINYISEYFNKSNKEELTDVCKNTNPDKNNIDLSRYAPQDYDRIDDTYGDISSETNTNYNIKNTKSTDEDIPDDFDCIINIPAINLEKIIYTGKQRDKHLANYELVTSASDMRYSNGGNYIICGHSSRIYGHSLNRLKELKPGDKVYIENEYRTDTYIIDSITFEAMEDTSKYCNQSDETIITILSCAKYIADNRYIVIKCIKLQT